MKEHRRNCEMITYKNILNTNCFYFDDVMVNSYWCKHCNYHVGASRNIVSCRGDEATSISMSLTYLIQEILYDTNVFGDEGL